MTCQYFLLMSFCFLSVFKWLLPAFTMQEAKGLNESMYLDVTAIKWIFDTIFKNNFIPVNKAMWNWGLKELKTPRFPYSYWGDTHLKELSQWRNCRTASPPDSNNGKEWASQAMFLLLRLHWFCITALFAQLQFCYSRVWFWFFSSSS